MALNYLSCSSKHFAISLAVIPSSWQWEQGCLGWSEKGLSGGRWLCTILPRLAPVYGHTIDFVFLCPALFTTWYHLEKTLINKWYHRETIYTKCSPNDIGERKKWSTNDITGGKIDQQTFQACLQKIERVNTVYTAPEKVNSSLLLL